MIIHIGVGSDVVCSTIIGNARASMRGTDNRCFHAFLCLNADYRRDMKTDMNALDNAHTLQTLDSSLSVGFTPSVLPEANGSPTGVSSDFVPAAGQRWYVLRVLYNRWQRALEAVAESGCQCYAPMHYILKTIDGKKKRIRSPLLPNFVFICSTREEALRLISRKHDATAFAKFYLDRTLPREANGKHPPLIIPNDVMRNFIRATSTESNHVRIVTPAQCRFQSGDLVRVIEGEFEGVVGRVARIAGQQRVVVDFSGLCLVATAYIPSNCLMKI